MTGMSHDPGFLSERVVSFGMPCPLTLMPALLAAAGAWHAEWCQRPGCELMIGECRGDPELRHRWPRAKGPV